MKNILLFCIPLLIAANLLFAASPDLTAPLPDSHTVLQTLQTGHPRLYIQPGKIEKIKQQRQTDLFLAEMCDRLVQSAGKMLDEPPVDYILIGPRLLSQSRKCLQRVSTLAMAWHLTGNDLYLRRAKRELFAAAAFPDWHPQHFLDTAEMSMAFAIGYDWLYNDLAEYDRLVIRNALLEKGLKIGMQQYNDNVWWAQNAFNWNQVCNGGLCVGALAIADEEPGICSDIISRAVQNLPFALASYAPDGGWAEGPAYWGYASQYTVYMLAAMQSALGSDFGLANAPGFNRAAAFPVYYTGPLGLCFNFADGGSETGPLESLYWLAGRFNLPSAAAAQNARLTSSMQKEHAPTAFDILWYSPDNDIQPPVKDSYYKGIETVFLRSAWNDPEALFIGFKGGDNAANHSHLDLGSFVLDAFGERWAVDLGGDDYNLPGYWDAAEGGQRWDYFRLNNYSHNTLTLNDDLQRADAKAPIFKHKFYTNESTAVADLSAAYQPHANKVWRGIMMLDGYGMLIVDEIQWAGTEKKLTWNLTTAALVECNGRQALLRLNNKTIEAFIISPKDAVFTTCSAYCELPENPNTGFQRLMVNYTEKKKNTNLYILLVNKPYAFKMLRSLKSW